MEIEDKAEGVLPHSAAATWSGFIYQGRVALYHVLSLLIEKTEEELDDLFVQIDSLEDFTIIKYNEQGDIIPITMHQVKAVKSNYYSTYKDDFTQLEGKMKGTGEAGVKAYFHLSTQNEKSKKQIKALHTLLEIYCYDNDVEFCPLNEIDNKITAKIIIVLQKYGIGGYNNLRNVQLLFDTLERIVSDRVVYIHSLNHLQGIGIRNAAYDNPVSLNAFLNPLRLDVSAILQDEEYFEEKVKSDLNRYYQEYCYEVPEEILTNEIKIKMDDYLFLFNSLSSKEFKSFLQSIMPHKEVGFGNLQEYKDRSLDQIEIKDAFLSIITNIKKSNIAQMIGWTCNESKRYFPTSLNYSNSDTSKKRASERIFQTALSTNVEVPFNADYLITSECNVDDMQLHANNIIDVLRSEANNIISWKKIGLVDLETAKNKLND